MKTLACGIDIGSNTVRMLIAEVEYSKIVKFIHSEREVTRLGGDLTVTGKLSDEGINKTIELLKKFKRIIDSYNVKHVYAAATSAAREATNSDYFIYEAAKVGINIHIISGDEEAHYSFLGVKAGSNERIQNALIYDIGGGSTEFISVKDGGIHFAKSAPLGVIKLADRFNIKNICKQEDLDAARDAIDKEFSIIFSDLKEELPFEVIIGTAGTVTTIAAIDLQLSIYDPLVVSSHKLSSYNLNLLLNKLAKMTAQERTHLIGMEKGREDLIIPGILMAIEIIKKTNISQSSISDFGLREGLTIVASLS